MTEPQPDNKQKLSPEQINARLQQMLDQLPPDIRAEVEVAKRTKSHDGNRKISLEELAIYAREGADELRAKMEVANALQAKLDKQNEVIRVLGIKVKRSTLINWAWTALIFVGVLFFVVVFG